TSLWKQSDEQGSSRRLSRGALDAHIGRVRRLRRGVGLAFAVGLVGRRRLVARRRLDKRGPRRLAGEARAALLLAAEHAAEEAAAIAEFVGGQPCPLGAGGIDDLGRRTG